MIRQEKVKDYAQIFDVIRAAFESDKLSNHKEHLLVDQVRLTDAYIPELALVYSEDGEIIGHIFYSECFIGDHPVLALAPVAVLPEHQGKGIGTQLVEASLERAKWSGFSAIVVIGDPAFYRPYGFEEASDYNITAPIHVPKENYLVLPLYKGALTGISGTVKYAEPFYV
ncbi:MAG: N-acetyltransferase [Kurthia sp.]|nr:N-acetyltransferase [Candidatus Kurthia equi]